MKKTVRIMEDYSLTDTRKFVVEYNGKDYIVYLPHVGNSLDPIIKEVKEVVDPKTRANLHLLCMKYAEEREPKRAEVSE